MAPVDDTMKADVLVAPTNEELPEMDAARVDKISETRIE